jgi:hypothetical protein
MHKGKKNNDETLNCMEKREKHKREQMKLNKYLQQGNFV